jgi:hypothetical protein
MVDALSWEVLNATADDWESLEQIHQMVNRFFTPVDLQVITEAVDRLIADGLLERMLDGAKSADGWFRMTDNGRVVWEASADTYAVSKRQ